MKKISTLLVAFLLPLLTWAQSSSKIVSDLALRMAANPAEYQEVLVSLADQVDTRALHIRYEAEKTPLQQRSYEVITLLQEKANATQPALLAKLNQIVGIDKTSVSSAWVNNVIFVRANAAAIEQIAALPEVGELAWNFPIEVEHGINMQPSTSIPNGSEPGLRAIRAPFMWAKGYTGYGRKGMIIDTGDDGDHPALASNFWGNQVPKSQAWNGSGWPEDCADHGSHVTGTVCGLDRKTNDTIGVAYNAHWMGGPMNFGVNPDGTGCTVAFSQTVYSNIQSFQWALNPDNNNNTTSDQPDAINCSWRSGNVACGITSVTNLLNSLEAAGIAIVFSQGNDGPAAGTVTSGAAMNMDLVNTFAVGAVNGAVNNFPIADFSSRGPTACGGTGSLNIKPEVSAPGVSVRSAFNGGIYSAIDGTSMASPHVAGAILLLKEAFPTLSGTQIKLALYNSATDLGTPGEDNTYGNGMINLEAAYNYLVDNGNTPVPPVSYNREAILADVKTLGLCNGPVNVTIGFENAGTTTITSLDFSYGVENGATQTYQWTGSLAPNTFVNFELPPVTGITPGTYTMVVEITSVNGQTSDDRPLNNRFKTPFTMKNDEYASATINAVQNTPVCSGGRVLLTYATDLQTNEVPQWFSSPSGGSPLAEGVNFMTPALTQSTTYYVSAATLHKVGKTNMTGTATNSKEGALEFNALENIRLKSVKVYAPETGPRIIEVLDQFDAVVATKTINLTTTGEQRINLNMLLPAGSDYKLRLSGGKDLQHTSNSAGYPHTVSGIVSIVRGVTPAGANTTISYYYFFDWEVELAIPCGRTPVTVSVTPSPSAPAVSFEATPTTVVLNNGSGTVNFNDLTSGVTSRFWDFGNGQTATDAQPSTTYTQPGTYKAYLVAATANGCSNVAEKTITVQQSSSTSDPVAKEEAVLYPNPTDGSLNLAFVGNTELNNADLQIFDLVGKNVMTLRNAVQQSNAKLDVSTLTPGVYFIQILDDKGVLRWSGKFIKA